MERINLCSECLRDLQANGYINKIILECETFKTNYSCFHQYIKNKTKIENKKIKSIALI
jgi:hypothetical protein